MTDTTASSTTTDTSSASEKEEENGITSSGTSTTTDWLLSSVEKSSNSNLNSKYYSKEWIDQWTTLGLSKYGISLPMICVLGDTSSGKSSVLSSLVGIELPSASTLTTKCPVLIQLKKNTSNENNRAIVDIQWHTSVPMHSPRRRKRTIEKHVEERHHHHHHHSPNNTYLNIPMASPSLSAPSSPVKDIPPPPPPPPPIWIAKTLSTNLESELPKTIQQAQDLILEYRETMVAPDVVCVTLYSNAEETDELTLVDLPGLVQFQHTHDVSLLSQVEHVIAGYLHNPRSILLPVIAAPTNIHNSKVLQLALTVDPTSARTIPVLTKPDLMDPGSESDVLELLQPQQSSSSSSSLFQHGFFLVKNRGQALLDAGATIAEGLQEEQDYFQSTLPWNALSPGKNQLGIPALRTTCAQVLWRVMTDTLPEIWQDLHELHTTTQQELEAMGTRFHTKSEQRKFYHNLTHNNIVSQISSSLSGKGPRRHHPNKATTPAAAGASQLHAACHDFFKDIQGGSLATVTSLVEGATVLVSSTGSADDVKGELVYVDRNTHDFACVDFVDPKDHTTDVLFDGVGYTSTAETVAEEEFDNDEVWSDGSRVFIGRNAQTFDSLRKIPLHCIRTDPSWLVDKIRQYRTDDLACFVNVDMFRSIVAEFVQDDWAPPCQRLLASLQALIQETLDLALTDHLESTRYPLLRTLIESTTHHVAQELLETARHQVEEHLLMEQQHPYTQDQVLLEAMNQARYESLQKDLSIQLRLDQEGVVYDTQAIQSILDRVFVKHSRQHWMAEQMELVLSCYGKVATQRVLDRTPQLCWQTCRQLPSKIQEELGCVTDDVLEQCLWESPESRERYQALTQKLDDLKRAMDVVKSTR